MTAPVRKRPIGKIGDKISPSHAGAAETAGQSTARQAPLDLESSATRDDYKVGLNSSKELYESARTPLQGEIDKRLPKYMSSKLIARNQSNGKLQDDRDYLDTHSRHENEDIKDVKNIGHRSSSFEKKDYENLMEQAPMNQLNSNLPRNSSFQRG